MKPICVTAQSLIKQTYCLDRVSNRYVINDETGCWEWLESLDRYGYGRVRIPIGGRVRHIGAHRVSWWAYRGPIYHGLQLDHLCRNRKCVNPWHLEPVTNKVNSERGNGPPKSAGRPRSVALTGCTKHGFDDGYWYTTKKYGTDRWVCRPCRIPIMERWNARQRK